MAEEPKENASESAPPRVVIRVDRTVGEAVSLIYPEKDGYEVYQDAMKALSAGTPAVLFAPDLQNSTFAIPREAVVGILLVGIPGE